VATVREAVSTYAADAAPGERLLMAFRALKASNSPAAVAAVAALRAQLHVRRDGEGRRHGFGHYGFGRHGRGHHGRGRCGGLRRTAIARVRAAAADGGSAAQAAMVVLREAMRAEAAARGEPAPVTDSSDSDIEAAPERLSGAASVTGAEDDNAATAVSCEAVDALAGEFEALGLDQE